MFVTCKPYGAHSDESKQHCSKANNLVLQVLHIIELLWSGKGIQRYGLPDAVRVCYPHHLLLLWETVKLLLQVLMCRFGLFFFLLCSCTREWKNNAGLRCYNQGLAEWDVSGKQYSATKKLKTTDMISSHLIPHTDIPTVKSVFLNIPLIDTVISKWETFLAFECVSTS